MPEIHDGIFVTKTPLAIEVERQVSKWLDEARPQTLEELQTDLQAMHMIIDSVYGQYALDNL